MHVLINVFGPNLKAVFSQPGWPSSSEPYFQAFLGSCVPVPHAVEDGEHRILRKLLAVGVSEDHFRLSAFAHLVEDIKRRPGQRDVVILVHLHALARDLPNRSGRVRSIDLCPPRADNLVCPTESEDQEVGEQGRTTYWRKGCHPSFAKNCLLNQRNS